jgi:glutathione synthase/RimK-type ligase-like ATP-grasp enzyme
MPIWVYTGGRLSESAYALAHMDGFRRMTEGKGLKKGQTIVNWGVGDDTKFPEFDFAFNLLNCPDAVCRAVNKKSAFSIWAGHHVSTVPWTANKAVAKEWLASGHIVVVRKLLTGHEGNGIVIVEPGEQLPDAQLYTRYIKNRYREFRVHATRGQAFASHMKIKNPHDPNPPKTWKVRSYANGFIFQRNNVPASAKRDALAVEAVSTLGLDFGAVDILEDKNGNFFVLEVNTAPGIEGQTTPAYAKAIKELVYAY